MKVTGKTLAALSGALVLCIAATLLLTFAGRETPGEEQEATYFFTNYTSPDMLLAAEIENQSGSVVIALIDGTAHIAGDWDAGADTGRIQDFFQQAYRLPLAGLVEDASASDGQFGLTEPQATVLLQDIEGGGALFDIGALAPDGEHYYTCLTGDARVFLMDRSYAELFLEDVGYYYDLSLYPSLDGEQAQMLQAVTVRRAGETAYRLEQVGTSENGTVCYYSLTEPFYLPVGTEQFESEILAPLRAITGTSLVAEPEDLDRYGVGADAPTLTLEYTDGTSVTLRIGAAADGMTYVLSESTGMLVTVPTAELAFLEDTPAEVAGHTLLSLNVNSIETIALDGHTYQISGSAPELAVTMDGAEMPLETFQEDVMAPLNEISIQDGDTGDLPTGDPILTAEIQLRYASEPLLLEFYAADSRRCVVSLDGTAAFWCDRVAIDPLVTSAA